MGVAQAANRRPRFFCQPRTSPIPSQRPLPGRNGASQSKTPVPGSVRALNASVTMNSGRGKFRRIAFFQQGIASRLIGTESGLEPVVIELVGKIVDRETRPPGNGAVHADHPGGERWIRQVLTDDRYRLSSRAPSAGVAGSSLHREPICSLRIS